MTSSSLQDRRSRRRSPAPVAPPSRARTAVSLVVGLAVASVGGVVVALWERSGTPIPPPQPIPSRSTVEDWPDGGIVYLDYPARLVGVARPDGTDGYWVTESIPLAPSLWAAAAPDGRTLLTEDGLLLDLTSRTEQMHDRLSAVSRLSDGAAPRQAWADHGRAILVTGQTDRGPVVRMVDASAGVTLAEWTGVRAAAADPTRAAAALEVLADGPVANGVEGFPLTSRVELGEATGMRTTMLTAVEFGAAVGTTEFQRLVIDGLQFSPDGALLALSGRTTLGAPEEPSFGGFVVLTRGGHVAYAQPAEVGAWWWLGWVDQRTLVAAFRDANRHPPLSRMISVSFSADGETVMTRGVPLPDEPHAAASGWGACVVAPDERRLVCGSHYGWLLLDTKGAPAQAYPRVPGRPLAWIHGTD